jgi:hypothetical protein
MVISHWIPLKSRKASLKISTQYEHTYFKQNNIFPKILPVMRQRLYCSAGRTQITIKYSVYTLHAVYITLQNTLIICNTYYFLPQQLLHKRALILLDTEISCLWPSFGLGRVEIQNILNWILSTIHMTKQLWMWTWHVPMDPNVWNSCVNSEAVNLVTQCVISFRTDLLK